jgi:AcrR family transcriptional regulator
MGSTRTNSNGVARRAVLDLTRARLLQAAADVFAEVGYHAATIREISRRAGANVAAVNYHFGDKLELYTEVLRQNVQGRSLEAIRNALDSHVSPEQTLRGVIKALLARMCTDDQRDRRWRLMMHELAQPTPVMSRIIDETIRPLNNRLRELIGAMIRRPSDDEKTRLCTNSIIGQVILYAHWRPILARLWPELKMTPAQLERIADHIAEFSLAYLREAASANGHAPLLRHARRSK